MPGQWVLEKPEAASSMPEQRREEDYHPLLIPVCNPPLGPHSPDAETPASVIQACSTPASFLQERTPQAATTQPQSEATDLEPHSSEECLPSRLARSCGAREHSTNLAEDIQAAGTPPRAALWRESNEVHASGSREMAKNLEAKYKRPLFSCNERRWRGIRPLAAASACLVVLRLSWPLLPGRGSAAHRSSTEDVISAAEERPEHKDCHTAVHGEECYRGVKWAMSHGIESHPLWYKGLTNSSSFESFQELLHRNGFKPCKRPCGFHKSKLGKDLEALSWDDVKKAAGRESKPTSTSTWESSSTSSSSSTATTTTGTSTTTTTAKDKQRPALRRDAICSPNYVPPPRAPAPVWKLSEESLEHCWQQMSRVAPQITGKGKFGRNWCWVGMKEFGCHRHLWKHWTWSQFQVQAIEEGATVPEPFQPLTDSAMCDKSDAGHVERQWTELNWAGAAEWFEENVALYVLSLPQSEQRKRTISKRLKQLGLPFEFVWGVDMTKDNALWEAKKEGLIPWEYDVERAQLEANAPQNDMGRDGSIYGTVGCASGHFRAQMTALKKTPNKPLTVILEDDVSPSDDFVPRLWALVSEELPCDWQAVALSSRCPYGRCISKHLTRVLPDVNEPAWRCRHGVNYGFQGVLYRTAEIPDLQAVWKPVVFDETRPHCLDVDVALASISDVVNFYAVPSVQAPGLLTELHEGSSRISINKAHNSGPPPTAPPWQPQPPQPPPPPQPAMVQVAQQPVPQPPPVQPVMA